MMTPTLPLYPFDPAQSALLRWFGPLTAVVLAVLWDAGTSLPTPDIARRVAQERAVGYNAVVTTLERLRTQGMVVRMRNGGSWRYKAVETQLAFEDRQERAIIESLGLEPRIAELEAELARRDEVQRMAVLG